MLFSRLVPLAVALGLVYPAPVRPDDDRETREVRLAESSLLWGMVTTSAVQGRAACEPYSPVRCCPDRMDLALALLGNKQSAVALEALAALVRFRLDGSVSEDFHCYVLAKGKPLLKQLRKVVPADLVARCEREVTDAKKGTEGIDEVQPTAICRGRAEIEAEIRMIASAIAAGRKCADEDF
jgi:hypothetical protein